MGLVSLLACCQHEDEYCNKNADFNEANRISDDQPIDRTTKAL
jgi:hypothetical protein